MRATVVRSMRVTTRTLPDDDDGTVAPVRVDHLYLVLAGGAPHAGPARISLAGIDRVEVGRGARHELVRDGARLRLDVDDPFMSSAHLAFERERAHWVAIDAGSRNGIAVDGVKHARAIVRADNLVEAGRSLFVVREAERDIEPVLAGPLATLDPELARVFAELARISRSTVPVLVGGPTGSGKERVARAVHAMSRRAGAFVAVNCASLPAGLVESELFGHRRGAFSGAIADQLGLVSASDGGTLFLDEIGDLPPAAQAALLRVLEEHEVRAVGATSAVAVDLRVVAATHRDLDELVAGGTFRDDLVARLAGHAIELPALADRRVDLGLALAELLPAGTTLAGAAARALFAYAWPRNLRELARAVERAVALANGTEITLAHLPAEVAQAKLAPPPAEPDAGRDELDALLEKHTGNVTHVAADLGRVRQQVQRWLKRYGLDPERYR